MRRYLLVALWPAGLAAIAAATVVAARRVPASPAGPGVPVPGGPVPGAPGPGATRAGRSRQGPEGIRPGQAPGQAEPDSIRPGGAAGSGQAESGGQQVAAARRDPWCREGLAGLVQMGAIGGAGGVAAYRVMASLAAPIVNRGLAIDDPIFRWTESHQVGWWAAAMRRLNTIGNVWTTWGAVGAAAACLGVSWRHQRWLPPTALGLAVLVDHQATHKLHATIARLGPPTNPLGTYPAGGPDRIVLFTGLIAYLLWREFSGTRRGRIWAVGAVSALAFSQAYSRGYLGQHWFIDIVCGLLYGILLLGPFIAAVRLVTGPAGLPAGPGTPALAGGAVSCP